MLLLPGINPVSKSFLVHMIDSWLNAMENGKMVVVLVDFKKAFDLVDYQILLSK